MGRYSSQANRDFQAAASRASDDLWARQEAEKELPMHRVIDGPDGEGIEGRCGNCGIGLDLGEWCIECHQVSEDQGAMF